MFLRRSLHLVALTVILAGSGLAAEAALVQDAPKPKAASPVVAKMSLDELEGILKALKYEIKRLERSDALMVTVDGVNVLYRVSENRESLQAYVGFHRDDNTSLDQMNEWNKDHRFSCAYLDDEGDPCMKLDLDMAGGVTRARVEDYLLTVKESVILFRNHLQGGGE